MKRPNLLLLVVVFISTSISAQWNHRLDLKATSTGQVLSNFQVLLILDKNIFDYSKANSTGDDLRFSTDSSFTSGSGLSYWIEEYDVNGESEIWIKLPAIPSSGDALFYMHYGNDTASPVSDGNATFELFDHFEGGSYNAAVWTPYGFGSVAVQSSYVRFTQDLVNFDSGLLTDDIKTMDSYKIKARFRQLDSNSNFNIQSSITNNNGIWHVREGQNSEFDFLDENITVGQIDSTGKNIGEKSATFIYTLGEWYKGESWFSGSTKYTVLDSLSVSSDTNIFDNDYMGICVFSRDNSQPRVDVDWIFVRKFSDPEPEIIVLNPGVGIRKLTPAQDHVIYPNPSSGQFTVELSGNASGLISVYNFQGQLIKTIILQEDSSNTKLDLSNYVDGVYLISICQSGDCVQRRIVKME